ncbi:hypothetical protein L596_000424 [Steinernema carpocapsae]|uniref:Reverse transcriptase domain-containing protein n=1 Tax=Steinernema carpocapsae TaxID=34508 RepID=A0A4U8UKG8_STECR|nr:hypothetical protein L596_000424 [Steinernema carpocapsae]
MRARVQILKKGDAEPTFFRFFDDLRAAKPESPLAEVTTEALQKFAELQASGSRPASTTLGPLRKRPFRGSGAGDSRAFTAYFHRDQVGLLSQQVHQLQQQLLLGSRPQQAPGRFTSGGRSIQCFNCRGHGHFRGTVPKAEPVANKKSDSVVGLSVPARYKTSAHRRNNTNSSWMRKSSSFWMRGHYRAQQSNLMLLIVNLSWLNQFLEKRTIKFERLETIAALLPKGGFMVSFDMKSGYHHVQIPPMLFTKLFRPLLEKWRAAGISCALYLDDGLVFARSRHQLLEHVQRVRADLSAAGIITSPEKCQWDPVQCLTWIQVTGNLASLKFVFGPAAQLKSRSLHQVLAEMEFCPERAKRPWSADEWEDLQWWIRELVVRNKRSLEIAGVARSRRLATDASATGAGAVIWNPDGSITRTAINLTPEARAESSTYREVYAVLFALQAFGAQCADAKIVVQIDNLGAVSVIQKGSTVASLQCLAREIFEFAENRDDWGIRAEIFEACALRWGAPEIDIFANSRNAKCSRFLSRYADFGSEGIDAFASAWHGVLVWAVPPPSLVPRFVKHLEQIRGKAILGVPYWPSHFMFPSLWNGQGWRCFVKDEMTFSAGSILFTPSTYEESIFNTPASTFDFSFLYLDFSL